MGNKSSKRDFGSESQKGKSKRKGPQKAMSESDIPSLRGINTDKNVRQRPKSEVLTEEQAQEKRDDFQERAKTKARFESSLHDLLKTWPEYSALESLDTDVMVIEGMETLQKVFTRITEQYEYNKTLSREKLDLGNEVEELREETESQQQKLKEHRTAMTQLSEDVGVLKGELKRRGFEPRLPNRTLPELSFEGVERRTEMSDGSEHLSDRATKDRSIKAGYMPTPLIQMAPNKDISQTESLLKRSTSNRKGNEFENKSHARLADELNEKLRRITLELEKTKTEKEAYRDKMEDLSRQLDEGRRRDVTDGKTDTRDTDAVRRIKSDLEHEQQANRQLKEKLDALGSKPRYAVDRRKVVDNVVEVFKDLRDQALSQRLQDAFDKTVGRTSRDSRMQFICAIMEEAFGLAHKTVRTFIRTIRDLIKDPIQIDGRASNKRAPSLTAGPKLPRSRQENSNFTRGSEQRKSVSAIRSYTDLDIPRELMQDIEDFVESISDKMDTSQLAEIVIETLTREFRECITPALINNNQFNSFLQQCCNLAWRMNIAAPPFYMVSSQNDSDTTVDRKLHDIESLGMERTINQIDFYAWPVLFSRKNGVVLIRGSVVLQRA